MKTLVRRVAAASILLMAVLAGSANAQDKLKATAVTPLGYLIAYTGMLYGEGGGFMANAGLDLTVQAAQGSAQGMQLVLSGQALVARGAGIDVMNAVANRNVPVVAIGTIAHIAPLQIISSAANPIRGPKDMAGKTIGVASVGGASEQTLLLMLAAEGVDPNTVTRQVVGPSAGSFGLVQGRQVDAFVGTNAAVAELTARNVPFHHFATHDVLPVPGQVYITSRENLTSKTEELVRFLRGAQAALKDAEAQIQAGDISKLLKAIEKYNVPEAANPEAALAGIRIESASWIAHGRDAILRNDPAAWETATKAAVQANVIPQTEPTRFHTNEIWDKAFNR